MRKREIYGRILSAALAVVTTFSGVPITAYAEDINENQNVDEAGEVEALSENVEDEEYYYLDSNMRLSWGEKVVGDRVDYQEAKFSNVGTKTHSFFVSSTNWTMWDIIIPDQQTINPGQTVSIYVRPNFDNPGWKEGDYADSITLSAYDSDGCVITDNASVNLYITIKPKAQPWIGYVDVYPSSLELSQGQIYTFEEDVYGGDGADLGVTWSIQGNSSSSTSINSNGTLTVGNDENASNILVTATSKQDPSEKGTANVSITKNKVTVGVQATPANGGSVSGGGSYNKGDSCTIVANPSNGYKFEGWFSSSGSKVSGDSRYIFSVSGSDTYTARFTQNSVRITTKKNIDKGGSITESQTVIYGGSVVVQAKANSGYTFKGWYEGNNKVTDSETYAMNGITSDRTLTAIFDQNQYTIALSSNPKEGGTVTGGGTYNKGTDITLVAKPADGYTFVGWIYNNQTLSYDKTCNIYGIDRDYSIFALFQKNNAKQYNVAISSDTGHGSIAPSGTVAVESGKTLVVAFSADANYRISDVKVDGKSVGAVTSYTFYNMANNHTVVASFVPIQTAKKDTTPAKSDTKTASKETSKTSATEAGTGVKPTDKPATDGGTLAEDSTQITELKGTLQELNVTREEARTFIQNNDDRALMEMALYRGDLEVTVVNKFADIPKETATTSYYDIQSVPNFEDVMDAVLTEEQKLDLFEGTKVRTNLSINVVDTDTVPEIEKRMFDENANVDGITLGSYFDMHFITEIDGMPALVTNLAKPIEIIMNVPETMKGAGQYCVLRYHDGEMDVLPNESTDPSKVIFHTDKMSTFALGYYGAGSASNITAGTTTNTASTSNTNIANTNTQSQTGQKSNNTVIYILLGVIAAGIFAISAIALSSGKNNRKRRK